MYIHDYCLNYTLRNSEYFIQAITGHITVSLNPIQIVAEDKQGFQITIEPVYKTLNITEKYFYL